MKGGTPVKVEAMTVFDRMMNLRLGLMEMIIPLERQHGVWYPETLPADMYTRQGQMLAKEHAYRVTEELLGEVLEAQSLSDRLGELTDSFLFYLSFCVIVGVRPDPNYWAERGELSSTLTSVELAALVMNSLMLATNMLKARPWRRDFDLPDLQKFDQHVQMAGCYLWRLFRSSGVTTWKQLEGLYLEKHENAIRRLQSGY